MAEELRCEGNKLHGIAGDAWIEFRCNSVFCGSKPGVVVVHRWHIDRLHDGPETIRYKDPGRKT